MSRWTMAQLTARGAKVVGAVAALEAKCDRGSKYGNVKTRGFDSKHEAKCARDLQLRLAAGEISQLAYQVPYELIPAQYDEAGRLLERSCRYFADFVYVENNREVICDAKGCRNAVYVLKRKLMLHLLGIRVIEL